MSLDETSIALLKKDRVVIISGLIVVTILAWIYLIAFESGMGDMSGSMDTMIALQPWTLPHAFSMFIMWTIMSAGMMVPSAGVYILMYARVYHGRIDNGRAVPPTGAFLGGYLTAWTAFSLVATFLQYGLETAALLTPVMSTARPVVSSAILIVAGIYQLTPLKTVCLSHCRAPLQSLTTGWRTGTPGAYAMGLKHGANCLGCCWALMALIFVGGIVNLLLVATIAIFVLLEKSTPFGLELGRFTGIALILLGTWNYLG